MKFWKTLNRIAASIVLGTLMASCSLIEDDLPECGLDLYFRYDYNLQRADMFRDHVGSVRAYVYDANDKLVAQQTESVVKGKSPFKRDGYHMHFTLPKGQYKVVAVAFQKDYDQALLTPGAKFRYHVPQLGDDIRSIRFDLDHAATPDAKGRYAVDHQNAPLDTLWVGMSGNQLVADHYVAHPEAQLVEVGGNKGATRDTISLVRNTKHINVTLRELQVPDEMDVADYDMQITDKNGSLLWNNEVDESTPLVYTPYKTWVTTDRTTAPKRDTKKQPHGVAGVGKIAHADFMTSRLLYHERGSQDAVLKITYRPTGEVVAEVNLPDILSRLRTSADLHRYTQQQFLDRGYDYDLSFFFASGKLKYFNISISILGWSRRFQVEDL